MDLYVLPEIRSRQADGKIAKPFPLIAAQIIFCDSKVKAKVLVRLNNEVQGKALVKFKDGRKVQKGNTVAVSGFEDIKRFRLPPGEEDCAHITIVKVKSEWVICFDARYNKDYSKKHFECAEQFLKVAQYCYKSKFWNAFADKLYSATELLVNFVTKSCIFCDNMV